MATTTAPRSSGTVLASKDVAASRSSVAFRLTRRWHPPADGLNQKSNGRSALVSDSQPLVMYQPGDVGGAICAGFVCGAVGAEIQDGIHLDDPFGSLVVLTV